ncbi:isochorismatase family protein [Streptomyces sp. A5-4]|uniref:isochorismatase family protein n=1 Tax=Streptomyces sp. A5-4 TaxID=3384771 RepID=UPI003DA9033F
MEITENAALVVVDVQKGFEEEEHWGVRNNPAADDNIAALIDVWQATGRPVVFVRHDSLKPASPLRVGYEGNGFKEYVEKRRGKGRRGAAAGGELFVTKSVNSAFYGTPDLDAWLRGGAGRGAGGDALTRGVGGDDVMRGAGGGLGLGEGGASRAGGGARGQLVVAGIQTNMCAETTARMGGNLGYEVFFALDATYTFDAVGPWGWALSADELARATAVSLHGGGFATVVRTEELVRAAGSARATGSVDGD